MASDHLPLVFVRYSHSQSHCTPHIQHNTGDILASCSGDKTVRLWARAPPTATDRWHCTAVLEGTHTRTVRSCSWSPNAKLLATASFDRTVAIWERSSSSFPPTARSNGNHHHSIATTQHEDVDAMEEEMQQQQQQEEELVEEDWEHVATLEGHENEVKAAIWAPNGNYIATCGRDKTVWVWESAPGHEYEVVDVKHGHTQDVKTVTWHPRGDVLASASYDDTIKLWVENDDEWICVQTLGGEGSDGHQSTVWDVRFDPGQGRHLVSASDDGTLKVWACGWGEGGEFACVLVATSSGYHSRTIFSVDWSSDGYLATASADNSICVFRVVESGGDGKVSIVFECRIENAHALCDVNCVRWSPHDPGLLASAGDDGNVRLWRFQPSPDAL